MRTPFTWLADRVVLGPRALRWGTTAALVVSIVIIVAGGVVRLTGSGLGCPTWPECETGSIATTPELGIHGFIEFANRALTGVLCLAVGWAIVAARLQRPRNRTLTRLAWSEFWLVVVNAIAGGVTVHTGLNPWVVALHFLLAIALLTTTTLTWHRALDAQAVAPVSSAVRGLGWTIAALTLVLIAVGTLVTGSGPHSGDSADVPRMGFEWVGVTAVHATLGTLLLVVAVILLVLAARDRASALLRRRVITFLVVAVAQSLLGTAQAFTGLPEVLVGLHLLGAALVWVGALRVLLDANPGLVRSAGPTPATVETAAPAGSTVPASRL